MNFVVIVGTSLSSCDVFGPYVSRADAERVARGCFPPEWRACVQINEVLTEPDPWNETPISEDDERRHRETRG